ncbi:MAG TPA: glycoside hydrolase family 15 protein, partial [Terriglobales bacterium]|nr:glycoside hydrolase family 15 protein [Terriglobales bacterium]
DESPHGRDVENEERIVRLFRCRGGAVRFRVRVHPTFDFARAGEPGIHRSQGVTILRSGERELHVAASAGTKADARDGAVVVEFELSNNQTAWLTLGYAHAGHTPELVTEEHIERWLGETSRYWKQWSASMAYDGDWRELVMRSALTLKLLIYEPSGAIVAAPTCSLPEWIGGSRNWDYRYTWLRDSSFTLIALMELGYFGEARDFLRFLHRTLSAGKRGKVLYSIDGGTEQTEYELKHLEGYWKSQPVRVGNGAANQRQFDVAGELMQCISLYWRHDGFEHDGESFERDYWPLVKRIGDRVAQEWREPDNGIWEVRGGLRQFVHSKGLCWVALDRALRLARRFKISGDFSHWEQQRAAIHHSLETEGFNPDVQAYIQYYGSGDLDASVLRLPILNVFSPEDQRMRSTVAKIESRLGNNGLVYRYNPAEDGIGETEGAFLACGFWLVENYVLAGRLGDAEELFERLCSCANDLGLMSEEADPANGQLLGNFPQGFSHVGLINAAVRLSAARRGEKTDTEELLFAH